MPLLIIGPKEMIAQAAAANHTGWFAEVGDNVSGWIANMNLTMPTLSDVEAAAAGAAAAAAQGLESAAASAWAGAKDVGRDMVVNITSQIIGTGFVGVLVLGFKDKIKDFLKDAVTTVADVVPGDWIEVDDIVDTIEDAMGIDTESEDEATEKTPLLGGVAAGATAGAVATGSGKSAGSTLVKRNSAGGTRKSTGSRTTVRMQSGGMKGKPQAVASKGKAFVGSGMKASGGKAIKTTQTSAGKQTTYGTTSSQANRKSGAKETNDTSGQNANAHIYAADKSNVSNVANSGATDVQVAPGQGEASGANPSGNNLLGGWVSSTVSSSIPSASSSTLQSHAAPVRVIVPARKLRRVNVGRSRSSRKATVTLKQARQWDIA